MRLSWAAAFMLHVPALSEAFTPRTNLVTPTNHHCPRSWVLAAAVEARAEKSVAAAAKPAPPFVEEDVAAMASCGLDHSHNNAFQNNGLFAWLIPYMRVGGFAEGKTLYGVIPLPRSADSEHSPVDEEEAARRRDQAAADLVNIGMEERQRRARLSKVFTVITAVYVIWAALLGDDGSVSGQWVRFGSALPLFFAFGFQLSAEVGLWDVDGNGLSKVEDPNLASAFLEKVNDLNIETTVKAMLPAAVFALLPHASSVALVWSSLGLAALYALRGKTPLEGNNDDIKSRQ